MFKKTLLLTLLLALLIPWAVAQQSLPYSYGFEDNDLSIDGWTKQNPSGLNASEFGINKNAKKTGNYGFRFSSYNDSGTSTQYLISPELSAPKGVNVSFYYKSSSTSSSGEKFKVGYSTTNTDVSSFSWSDEYSTSSTSWSQLPEFNCPAGTKYIAIYYYPNYQYRLYIDDISLNAPPSCMKPTGLAATLTPGNGTIATLNWTAGGEETAWVLEYGTTSDFTGATSVNVSGTPTKNLTGLTAETKYYARVKADCGGGDTSDWSATCEFTPTDQLIISILGTTSSTYSNLPSNTNYKYSYTQQIYTATEMGGFPCTLKSVAFKGNNAAVCNLDIYLANTTKSSFTSTSDYIAINEATLVFSGNVTFIADDWKTIEFDNEFDYTGGNLAVIVDDNSGNYDYNTTTWQTFNTTTAQALYFYQDDTNINPSSPSGYYNGTPSVKDQIKFDVELPSPYTKPQNLAVTNLGATTATITWEAPNSDVQSYKYQYREAGGSWSAPTSTTALSAPLTSLTGNTTYEFQVQAIYAGDNESGFASIAFTTPIAIPYAYGFEDESELDCWTVLNPVDNTDYGYQHQNWGETGIINNSDSYSFGSGYARTGVNCFLFTFTDYPDSNPPYQCLISPQITGIANGLHVEFYYRQYSNGVESFRVGYSTTDKNISSFTWGSQVENLTAEYQRFSANYPAGTKYVAIQHTSDDQYMIYIDDITFEEVASCLEPTGVTADNITTTGAEITWTNGGEETAWDIFVTTDPTVIPNELTTPTTAGITVKPHPLTSLTPATRYYVYVRSACSSTETSAWSTPHVFDTDCLAEDLPYSYGFENTDQYNICWNIINTNTSYLSLNINTNSSNAHNGTNSLYYYRGSGTGTMIAVLPEFDANYPFNEYEITFWAKGGGTFAIGIMTDPDDVATFVQQGENISITSSYDQYLVRLNGYTGSGHYIGIKEASTSNVGGSVIDDIEINHLPSCIEPDGLTVTAPTAHGATFGWTPNGTETEWHLYFGKNNTAPADDIDLSKVTVANSNPFTMTTGLDPETDYYVWVRANCGSTDGYSMWVGPETFTTEPACFVPTGLAASEVTSHTAKLSWTGTNESYNVRYRTAASVDPVLTEDFENETHYNNNWTVVNLSTANTPGRNSSAGHNSSYGFRFSSYSSASTYEEHLINTNELTGLTNGVIEFYYKKTNSSTETFAVGYSSTDKETTSFSFGANVTATTSWQLFHEEIPAGTKYVSIKYTTTDCNYYIYIDDIVIGNVIPAGAWQTVNPAPDSSPCTISDLSAETKYEAQVQGNCGSEGLSQWSSSIFFTTDIACPAPTGLTYANLKSNKVDLSWTNGGAENWVVAYKLSTDTDFTEVPVATADVTISGTTVTYTLTGLTPEKEYNVKVQDNCEASISGDGTSDFSNTITFETLEACAQPTGVTVDNIGHYSADLTWTGDSPEFIVKYRTAAFNDGSMLLENFNSLTTAGTIPTNWNNDEGTTTSTNYKWCHNDKTSGNGNPNGTSHDGSNCVVFNSYMNGDGKTNFLKTPSMDFPTGKTMQLTFWWKNPTGGDFSVYISTDGGTTKTPLKEGMTGQSTWKQEAINLTDYIGASNVTIHFKGTSNYGSGDAYIYLDDVVIGELLDAGSWQTLSPNPTTSSASLTGLTIGTKYDVTVAPSCDNTLVSDVATFTTLANNVKYFLTAGDWATATNWMDNEMPAITDNAIIRANATINNGIVAAAKKITFEGTTTPTLTINDGGQLQTDNNVTATVKKSITSYTSYSGESIGGYYLISTPINTNSGNASTYGMITDNLGNTATSATSTYDLYSWNRSQADEWRNYRNSVFSIANGTGYLYASKAGVELTFTGTVKENKTDVTKNPSYTEASGDTEFRNWNLYANPFVCNAYITAVNSNESETPMAFYKMNDAGDNFEAATGAIKPMEGVFVQATKAGQSFKFSRTAPVTSTGNLNIHVAQVVNSRDAHRSTDNAIIRFGEGNTLEKFSFNANNAKVYIPQEGKDYAVVNAANEGEMPVYFKAAENGNYSISFNAENVEFSYLHLIDNLTGNEVNLLETPSYSFDARTIDYASRFKLVFVTGQANMGDDFGFFDANGNLMILGIEGTATLQMIDVTGRIISSETFSGNYSKAINAKAGVYMLRLIQGNDVRTQKIVVR